MPKKTGSSSQKRAPKKRTATKKARPAKSAAREGQRLNKILASAGLGSRREVEELIVQGRVEVDHEIVTDLAFKTDPQAHTIKVDGQAIKRFRPVYFMLNKPKGVLSTNKDPSGRMRVVDFVPDSERVFSVGRLDKSSEGLMLLTNDGELAQKLAHPRYRISKTYFVVVSGVLTKEELAKLHKGVYLAEGFARIDGAKIRKQKKSSTELEITLSEGKNREIRRILARAGHKVVVLKRLAIGGLRLGQLPVGAARQLTSGEVNALYALTESSQKKKSTKKKTGSKSKTTKSSTKRATPQNKSVHKSHPEDVDYDDELIAGSVLPNSNSLEGDMDDEFVFTPGSTVITDDDWELDGDYDDDFVGGFTSSASEGKVLDYEEQSDSPESGRSSAGGRKSSRSSNRSSAGRGSARGSKGTGRASASSRSRSPSGSRGAAKRSVTKKKATKRAGPKRAGSTSKAAATKGRSTKGTRAKTGGNKTKGTKRASGTRASNPSTSAKGRGKPSKKSPSRKSPRKRR